MIRGADIANMINTTILAPIPADVKLPIVNVARYYWQYKLFF